MLELLQEEENKLDGIPSENIELVVEQMIFAKKLASDFYRRRAYLGIEREDYEGAALLGLCDAARRYDPSRGMGFKTFVYLRIRGAMFDLLRRGGLVPRAEYKKMVEPRLQYGERGYAVNQHDGREADETEVADDNDAPEQEHDECDFLPFTFARTAYELVGLAEAVEELGVRLHVSPEREVVDLSYSRAADPEERVMIDNTRIFIEKILALLPKKERQVVLLRYFEQNTFDEICEVMGGLSRSCVSRMHARALEQMRKLMDGEAKKCESRIAAAQ